MSQEIPSIRELPEAPSVFDRPDQFNRKAHAFVAALPGFSTDANAVAMYIAARLLNFDETSRHEYQVWDSVEPGTETLTLDAFEVSSASEFDLLRNGLFQHAAAFIPPATIVLTAPAEENDLYVAVRRLGARGEPGPPAFGAALSAPPAELVDTTDAQQLLALAVPASRLVAGSAFRGSVAGIQSNPASVNPDLVFSVTINGATAATLAVAMGTGAHAGRAWSMEFVANVLAVGDAGLVSISASCTVAGEPAVLIVPVPLEVDTTEGIDIVLAIAHSAADEDISAHVRVAALTEIAS